MVWCIPRFLVGFLPVTATCWYQLTFLLCQFRFWAPVNAYSLFLHILRAGLKIFSAQKFHLLICLLAIRQGPGSSIRYCAVVCHSQRDTNRSPNLFLLDYRYLLRPQLFDAALLFLNLSLRISTGWYFKRSACAIIFGTKRADGSDRELTVAWSSLSSHFLEAFLPPEVPADTWARTARYPSPDSIPAQVSSHTTTDKVRRKRGTFKCGLPLQ